MKPKAREYRNGWSCHMERVGAWYLVNVRNARGDLHDKVRCDDYRDGLDYWRSFNAIARNA